jgi:hypothetical protein
MERRSFLKAISVGAASLAMPSIVLPTSIPGQASAVYTVEGLTGALEAMFKCKIGEEAAFMQWTDMLAAHQWLTPNAFQAVRDKEKELIRITYQTIGYAVEGGEAKDAEAQLVKFCLNEFEKISEGKEKKMLIWRSKPEFSTVEITKWGKTYMTAEQIEDRTDLRIELKKEPVNRYWAFKVPANLSGDENLPPIDVPEGVDWDWETQSLRFFEEKTKLHKIRMRIAIPEYKIDEAAFSKPEGSPYPRLGTVNG